MLQVKNLSKIYKNKKGVDVVALDNISLDLPEKGMVFLLGKSGSGKSTLLNVCGGLDDPTTGEVIVKGRSSKNFTQKDFDSYRNTYVGFIFQEYNVLDEFTVEDNIALALELQGKPKDEKVINDILDQVDLKGYSERKPNTLSGGQKQRLAIARALVKNPEIIMADEPTGVLDSKTGKQIFDTLKELSKDKLIVVVSHDREFAEQYADRIIELKDGSIISDLSKYNDKFIETKEQELDKVKDDCKFIESKLPLKHAIKIGLSSLKLKPIRLVFTVLLCTVAFILLSIASTLKFYNGKSAFNETLDATNSEYIKLGYSYRYEMKTFVNGIEDGINTGMTENARFTEDDLNNYQKNINKDAFGVADTSFSYEIRSVKSKYWQSDIKGVGYLDEENSLRDKINGEYPKKDNEILITSYVADMFLDAGIYNAKGDIITLNTSEDIIGHSIKLNSEEYKIVGILDVGEIPSKYESLKNDTSDKDLLDEYDTFLNNGIYLYMFTTYNKVQDLSDNTVQVDEIYNLNTGVLTLKENSSNFSDNITSYIHEVSMLGSNKTIVDVSNNSDTLNDDEIIVSSTLFGTIIQNVINEKINNSSNPSESWLTLLENVNILSNGGEWKTDEKGNSYLVEYTDEEQLKLINSILNSLDSLGIDYKNLSLKMCDPYELTPYGDIYNFKLAKIVIQDPDNYNSIFYVTEDRFDTLWDEQKYKIDYYSVNITNYVEKEGAIYHSIVIPFTYNEETANYYYDIYSNKEYDKDDSLVYISSSFVSEFNTVDSVISDMSQTFNIISIIFIVFAVLLFSNFISASISSKTKEIGILRAIGATANDVFKIFFSESFAIAAICVIISIIGSAITVSIINNSLIENIGVSIMSFGILSILLLIVTAFLTTLISTFIPVYKAAKKKPVESIRKS